MLVPQPVKRTAGIAPNFLWDKTSYVLGVTAGDGRRTTEEHAAFIERHEVALAGTDDVGLMALLLFLRRWTPEQFVAPLWPEDVKDENVVFVLESERRDGLWLHDRAAAKSLWKKVAGESSGADEVCLVTGDRGPVARLHPAIKGVWGGQSSGGSIVSFNLDAFTSYGHEQGDNAPVSEAAAFAYTTALNRFLERDSGHRIQVGDASTVFWADAADRERAALAEGSFYAMFADESDAAVDAAQAKKVGLVLERLRQGEPLETLDPDLAKGVRFFVLALAPNAARISIRFWFEDDFGLLARNYQRFVEDMRIEPPWHREPYPPLWRYLGETAVLGKGENVPPNLAGAWMGAILGGTAYPRTLLATVLSRIRADGEVNALRVAGTISQRVGRSLPARAFAGTSGLSPRPLQPLAITRPRSPRGRRTTGTVEVRRLPAGIRPARQVRSPQGRVAPAVHDGRRRSERGLTRVAGDPRYHGLQSLRLTQSPVLKGGRSMQLERPQRAEKVFR